MKLNSRIPILLSAFGFPGLGQCMQKRWVPGVLFSAVFLMVFFWVMKLAIHNIHELYSMAFSSDFSYEPNPVPIVAFAKPLIIVGIVYLISLFDVFMAQQRIVTRNREKNFREEHESRDS